MSADPRSSARAARSIGVPSSVPFASLFVAKLLTNIAIRMPFPFLNEISGSVGITKARAGSLLGLGELGGLASFLIGRQLDRGLHRRWLVIGTGFGGVGALLLSARTVWSLALGYLCICFGVAVATAAGHAYLGHQVPFAQRARAMGIFETSWAVALLLGGPVVAIGIKVFNWSVPFALIGLGLFVCVPVLARRVPADSTTRHHDDEHVVGAFSWFAVITTVLASVSLTFGAIVVFTTFGAWLRTKHEIGTGGIGTVAMVLGAVELVGSSSVAAFADRIGKRRVVAFGSALMAFGASLMITGGAESRVWAVIGTLFFFAGFEAGFVALLAVVSEVGGVKRGVVVGVDHTLVGVMRASGTAVGPWLAGESSERFSTVVVISIALAAVAGISVMAGGRSS